MDPSIDLVSPEYKDASLNIGGHYEIEAAFLGLPLEKLKSSLEAFPLLNI
jgi:hypothetical protein